MGPGSEPEGSRGGSQLPPWFLDRVARICERDAESFPGPWGCVPKPESDGWKTHLSGEVELGSWPPPV